MKIIGIIGSRRRDSIEDFKKVEEEFLKHFVEGDTICSGLCPRGGDKFAVLLSEKYNTDKKWFPADWTRYGKGAGFMRNTDIAKNSDILIACVSEDRTGGTEDTIKKYLRLGKDKLFLV